MGNGRAHSVQKTEGDYSLQLSAHSLRQSVGVGLASTQFRSQEIVGAKGISPE